MKSFLLQRSSLELTNPSGKVFCDDNHRSTVNYTQTIIEIINAPCFCYSVAFNLPMQSGVVSESVVLNNFCVYDSDENVYEFEVSI